MARWTVRGVDRTTIAMVADVAENSGATYGELLNEIVAGWYRQLPETDEDTDIESAIEALLSPHTTVATGSTSARA